MNLVRRRVEVSDRVEGDCFAEFANQNLKQALRLLERADGIRDPNQRFVLCSVFNRDHSTAAVFWPNRGSIARLAQDIRGFVNHPSWLPAVHHETHARGQIRNHSLNQLHVAAMPSKYHVR